MTRPVRVVVPTAGPDSGFGPSPSVGGVPQELEPARGVVDDDPGRIGSRSGRLADAEPERLARGERSRAVGDRRGVSADESVGSAYLFGPDNQLNCTVIHRRTKVVAAGTGRIAREVIHRGAGRSDDDLL